ncbi:MAG: tetratricopeptide repeat protein [Planctomycetota bacterium]|jgi:tetratricopeptide (TPR) repeat protein
MRRPLGKYRSFLICFFLIVSTLAVYSPVLKHDFVKYDDDKYVTENQHVSGGISRQSVFWAFTAAHFHMWHPLTTLSNMLDCQLFGLVPGWHHLTSLLFHLANALLLFAVFKRMTGAVWQSAFVAAVFALHPLQVESVAWLSERKTVLSGLFWLLTIYAYVRYTEKLDIVRFLLVFLIFSLSIMTKPIVVTLPCVLLLLDYWPLDRLKFRRQSQSVKKDDKAMAFWRLVLEKLPLFVLSAVLSLITYNAQKGGSVILEMEKLPVNYRLANAIVSYLTYIQKMIWPSQLAVLYPHPGRNFSILAVVISTAILVLLTGLFIYQRRRRYLTVGWLWYLGTLVPVIGLVQAGAQARADRYMYMTMIGLLTIIAWTVSNLVAKWRCLKAFVALGAAVLLLAAAVSTSLQIKHWKNSETLFRHALDVTRNNALMHNNYANLLADSGRTKEAIKHFNRSLEIKPNSPEVHNNLGNALSKLGKADEAMKHYKKALHLKPKFAEAHYNLAVELAKKASNDEAIDEYRRALKIKPDYIDAWSNLGFVLAEQGSFAEAVDCYKKAIEFKPDDIITHGRLALALAELDKIDEAIKHCRIVLKTRPDDIEMHCNIGILLQRQGRIPEAINHYQKALQINPEYAKARNLLKAALDKQKNRK